MRRGTGFSPPPRGPPRGKKSGFSRDARSPAAKALGKPKRQSKFSDGPAPSSRGRFGAGPSENLLCRLGLPSALAAGDRASREKPLLLPRGGGPRGGGEKPLFLCIFFVLFTLEGAPDDGSAFPHRESTACGWPFSGGRCREWSQSIRVRCCTTTVCFPAAERLKNWPAALGELASCKTLASTKAHWTRRTPNNANGCLLGLV